MRLIQHYLPQPRHTEVYRIFVKAATALAWEKARHFDMSSVPWVRLLFDLRDLPNRLSGKPAPADKRLGIDQITDSSTGFLLLEERPGQEALVGAVGQFWHADIPFAHVPPAAFRDFQEPGWGKLAWSISVEPYQQGSTICLELRTTATDDESWRALSLYYGFIGIGSKLIRHSLMRHLEAELGKLRLPHEEEVPLPGDEFVPEAHFSLDHRTLIEAPAALVWRYLMQLGCDRAGWYSIDALDHEGIPSTDHLVPGWDTRAPGDKLDATLEHDGFFNVYAVQPEQYLVLGGEVERAGGRFNMSWAFVLEPVGHDACHLCTRVRKAGKPKLTEWLLGNVVYPPVHALMQEAQLRHLKQLAERDAQARIVNRSATAPQTAQ